MDFNWKKVTIYNVLGMDDEEGRRWKLVGTYDNEAAAKAAKGSSGYLRIECKTVFSEGPFKGVEPRYLENLPRYPIDQAMRDMEMEKKLKDKLTTQEWDWIQSRARG